MRILFTFLMLLLTSNSFATYYVFDSQTNRCVEKAEFKPDEADVTGRGLFVFYSKKDVPLEEAEFFNNDVRARIRTQTERNQKTTDKEKQDEMHIIEDYANKLAIQAAIADGKTFKHFKPEDFDK
mgnify:CR=1 FL=1